MDFWAFLATAELPRGRRANRGHGSEVVRARGREWTFEDFCRVHCSPKATDAALGAELNRSVGAIAAVRASIDAVVSEKTSATFPGQKWEEFVARAVAGECACGHG